MVIRDESSCRSQFFHSIGVMENWMIGVLQNSVADILHKKSSEDGMSVVLRPLLQHSITPIL
jgi:hypothetical protein